MFFASDNGSGCPPEVMAALSRANEGYARSYGADAIMDVAVAAGRVYPAFLGCVRARRCRDRCLLRLLPSRSTD